MSQCLRRGQQPTACPPPNMTCSEGSAMGGDRQGAISRPPIYRRGSGPIRRRRRRSAKVCQPTIATIASRRGLHAAPNRDWSHRRRGSSSSEQRPFVRRRDTFWNRRLTVNNSWGHGPSGPGRLPRPSDRLRATALDLSVTCMRRHQRTTHTYARISRWPLNEALDGCRRA